MRTTVTIRQMTGSVSVYRPTAAQTRIKHFDTDFHEGILACCGNRYLQSAYGLIAFKMQALRAHIRNTEDASFAAAGAAPDGVEKRSAH